ncbi:MAG: glutamate-1-semialdehyde 2,1-aminomutase [Deltaproteobacteria bacterium]
MAKIYHNSHELFQKAVKIIPGGVNSPVRACKSVGTIPAFIHHADGCMIVDMDGNAYIDYVGSWGPMILGHRHPAVMEAIRRVLERGTSFGAPTDLEIELAQLVIDAVPSIEMIRMVNSGTEATMSAIRLARGVTGRDLIIKFDGCYHGHSDALLVSAGSGVATLAIAGSPGVPDAVSSQTLSLVYNDSEGFVSIMDRLGKKVAAVIVEPVAGNMGMVPPTNGFLETLRSETTRNGSLLIFDEVMTGFRVAHGGAQALYNISPDLTTLGKIIGGGLPVGAYGGKRDIMAQIAPQGPVYQAGTLSGNPLAMAAGIATLEQIKQPGFYQALDAASEMLIEGLQAAIQRTGVKARAGRVGSMAGLFFTDRTVRNFDDAKTADLTRFSAFYRGMLEQGIYLAPSQFEALFISAAHGNSHIAETVSAAESVFKGFAA